ncbi:UDP-glucose dehydrogenase family protein [Yersinia artesiana]|uniref:UDP-glucose dehydrogenase family protein n=1 Tax=Yersinia artesiana TaxID=2890315 RepID=UPI0015843651|nr:UDP-glucose/GDP-mannose dehydrogenase family protein [Yersinia artesiana]
MKVTVFGIGYVGLVQAAVLAEVGHDVLCIDIDENKVADLQNGRIAIFEPGLAPLVKENYDEGRLRFSTDAAEGVKHGAIQFIAVGTPPDEDGAADLQYVLEVASTIANYMDTPKVIIDKSTVPVGTAEKVQQRIQTVLQQRGKQIAFNVVSNPEFLKEGAAVADCKRPERIVIGIDTDDNSVIDLISELYEPFNRNHDRMLIMDIRSAELTKYAANGMLATKISFMNEIANIAECLGADIEKVRQGIGSDSRIGYHFIYSGCGYGGSCFPKDIQALIRTAESCGYQPQLLQAVERVNNEQKFKLVEFIQHHFDSQLAGKTLALWGLAFKPNTDDMREAPSRILMEALWKAGVTIQAYDPEAMDEAQRIYGARDDLRLMGTKESALQGADALIICTEWQSFRAPDFDMIKSRLKHPVIFDGRNLYDPERLNSRGFTYYGIGRGDSINRAR